MVGTLHLNSTRLILLIDNIKLTRKDIQMSIKNKEPKAPRDFNKVKGVLQLFVLASISYSTYIVFLGTNGPAPKVMLVPQALFAVVLAFQKFTK